MQENVSNASFALLGRTYLQPSPRVPATVLARTCNRPRTYLQPSSHVLAGKDDNNYFPADTREFTFPSRRVKKRLCHQWDTV